MKDTKKALKRAYEAKAALDAAKAEYEAAAALVCSMMDALHVDALSAGKYGAKRQTIEQKRFDSKAFRADYSAIYEQYKRPVTVNRFTVSAQ